MANDDLIRGGTASVAAGSTAVTGQSVSWSNVREGDFFGGHVGLAVPIAAVAGSAITLAYPWPGATQSAATYAIQPKGDVTRFQDRVRQLLETLTNGAVAALATAGSAAGTVAYYTGVGTAALTGLTATAREYLAGGVLKIQNGGTYAPGAIYSDTSWGMLFRALRAAPGVAAFSWARSDGFELMRITELGQRSAVPVGASAMLPAFDCFAWARCDASGNVIASRNVSSVSRIVAGRYQVNFAVSPANTGYAATCSTVAGIEHGCYDYNTGSIKVYTGLAGTDTAFTVVMTL